MKWFRWMIYGPPYRGWFGWATICVVLFIIIEAVWRGGAILQGDGWFLRPYYRSEGAEELPLGYDVRNIHILKRFFLALAVWLSVVLVGAVFVRRLKGSTSEDHPAELPGRSFFGQIVAAFPYRGLTGWALMCAWLFFASEILWSLSIAAGFLHFPFRQNWLEFGWEYTRAICIVPYCPSFCIIGVAPYQDNGTPFYFYALASWVVLYLLGAFVRPKRKCPIYWGLRLVLIVNLVVIICGTAFVLLIFRD